MATVLRSDVEGAAGEVGRSRGGLARITYDSEDDLLDVALDSGSHLIRQPREIMVEESPTGLASVAVVDADGVRHIIRLKQPLMLPPVSLQQS